MNRSSLLERLRDRVAASSTGQRVWAYYEAATPRDQLLMIAGGSLLALLLAWLLVIAPLHGWSRDARADYERQRETLSWMEANRHRVSGVTASERPPGEALLTLANRTAATHGISFRRYEPVGDNGLSVTLEGMPFNLIMQWLGELERNGVVARELSLRRRDEAGLVDARIVIEE